MENQGGSFHPEWVATFTRNGWQVSTGMGGRFGPEYTYIAITLGFSRVAERSGATSAATRCSLSFVSAHRLSLWTPDEGFWVLLVKCLDCLAVITRPFCDCVEMAVSLVDAFYNLSDHFRVKISTTTRNKRKVRCKHINKRVFLHLNS